MIIIVNERIIFFFTDIVESKIKNNDIGKNVADSGFENIDKINANGDKNHVLCTVKYNEAR